VDIWRMIIACRTVHITLGWMEFFNGQDRIQSSGILKRSLHLTWIMVFQEIKHQIIATQLLVDLYYMMTPLLCLMFTRLRSFLIYGHWMNGVGRKKLTMGPLPGVQNVSGDRWKRNKVSLARVWQTKLMWA
jgi:hypothetical protein